MSLSLQSLPQIAWETSLFGLMSIIQLFFLLTYMDRLSGLGELAFNYTLQQGPCPKANARECVVWPVWMPVGQGSGLGPLGGLTLDAR